MQAIQKDFNFSGNTPLDGSSGFGCLGHTRVIITEELPAISDIIAQYGLKTPPSILVVCDANTQPIAAQILHGVQIPLCVLPPGEESKNWESVERILQAARDASLPRDGLFIGIGGGVVSDLTAFAASIYMRGTGLCLIPTTLLGMVDAALGGKTGIDLFGYKNLAGSFYPASLIFVSLEALTTLPIGEWNSGFGELIKTAILDEDDSMLRQLADRQKNPMAVDSELAGLISRAITVKGAYVEADPRETGTQRALLNLGHTFGHALESSIGLGALTHGEAVAWGIVRAGVLGCALGITPTARFERIRHCIQSFGFELSAPHPLIKQIDSFYRALGMDKKQRNQRSIFVVPTERGAQLVSLDPTDAVLKQIVSGHTAQDS